ncbi:MAG: transposase, partial [Methanoregula sp.]|nr:transposase [Methanoregula sp.]
MVKQSVSQCGGLADLFSMFVSPGKTPVFTTKININLFFSDVFGLSFSKATIARALKNCNDNLADYDKIVKKALSGAPVLNVDETGFRVTGKRRWLHVASTALLTWYGHHKNRGKSGTDALQILPDFKGTMVHDFWKTYFQYD